MMKGFEEGRRRNHTGIGADSLHLSSDWDSDGRSGILKHFYSHTDTYLPEYTDCTYELDSDQCGRLLLLHILSRPCQEISSSAARRNVAVSPLLGEDADGHHGPSRSW